MSLPPASSPVALWSILHASRTGSIASCSITNDGRCVTDGADNHGNEERCTFLATEPMFVTATQYHIEHGFDFLTLHGRAYRTNGQGPHQVYMVCEPHEPRLLSL